MSSTVLAVLYAIHLVAAVAWIGGLVMLSAVVTPGARRVLGDWAAANPPTQERIDALLAELERRFTPLANLSLVVLIATGMIQMSADPNYQGFLTLNDTWAWAMLLKHLAVLAMAGIAGYVALVLEPERRRLHTLAMAKRPDEEAKNEMTRRRARIARLNLACGVLTLLFTALATAQ